MEINQQYKPPEKKKNDPPRREATYPGSAVSNPLEGLTLRRAIGIEPKKRIKCCVYIEDQILAALGDCDLNFQANLALEHIITKHHKARAAIQGMDD